MGNMKVYPNPFKTSFITEFELGEDQTVTMQLISIDGKLVQTEKIIGIQGFNSCYFEVNSNVSTGSYILRLINESTIFATDRVSIRD